MTTGWIILRTAGRHTLKLAESLGREGFECWTPVEVLPAVPYTRNKGRCAMFPRYVFAPDRFEGELLALSHIDSRHAKFEVVKTADRVAHVRDAVIQQIREAETRANALAVPRKKMSPYSRGATVHVRSGVCKGLSGIVDRSDGRQADVWITLFGRHKRFTLPLYTLEQEEMKVAA